LNLQGRESEGIVPQADYMTVREGVTEALQTLRCPESKRSLIDTIIPREKAGTGPYMEVGPDLHLVMDNCNTVAYPMFAADGRLFTQQTWGDSGNHRPDGVFIATGGSFKHGAVTDAHLVDLAPTILHLLGVAVPDDLDGRVLTEAFINQFAIQHPIHYQQATAGASKHADLSVTEQADVAARLRALGYLGGPNDA